MKCDSNNHKSTVKAGNCKKSNNFNSSIIMGNKIRKSGVLPDFFKFNDCFPNKNISSYSDDLLIQLSDYYLEIKKKNKYSLKQKYYLEESIISDIIDSQNKKLLSLDKLRNIYYSNLNTVKPSLSTFRRLIRKNHGYTYKNVNVIHEKRKGIKFTYEFLYYLECYKEMLEKKELWVYVDESTFVEKAYRKKIWTKKESTNNLTNIGRTKSANFIAAVTKYGMVHYEFIPGKNNGAKFYNFIEGMIKKLQFNIQYKELLKNNRIRVIFDNSKVHVNKANRAKFRKLPLKFNTLPCYFPQINNVEFLFAYLKSKCKSQIFNDR